jgi:hypothetical protein
MRDTIHVQAVQSRRTAAGEKFDVIAKLRPGQRWAPMFATFDPWLASLAERSKELGLALHIEWSQSKFDRELRTARIDDAQTTEAAS